MARRNRSEPDRDDDTLSDVASLLAPAPVPGPARAPGYISPPGLLTEIEDFRTYHPEGAVRSALTVGGLDAAYQKKERPAGRFQPPASFEAPRSVVICVRRKQRREVLFATRKTGKGGRARRHRRNYYSNVRC